MANALKQDSNFTSLRYALEESPGVLPVAPVWIGLEPNDYKSFGGDYKTKARNPINPSRQRKKGVIVDLDASGEYSSDVTAHNVQDIAETFVFANLRRKVELPFTGVNGTTNAYTVAAGGAGFIAGDLLFAKNAPLDANNGLKVVSASTGVSVTVTDTGLLDGGTGIISRIGRQFAAGALTIDASGDLPLLAGAGLNTLGLIPGEMIFIGGDTAATRFHGANNNGFARVRSISVAGLVLDKTQDIMTDDDGTIDGVGGADNTIRVFVGRVLKNEVTQSLIVSKTIQLERTLGAPDTDTPGDVQSEYIPRCLGDEFELSGKTADILTVRYKFLGGTHETRDATQGLKGGTRPAIVEADAFNTTSDVAYSKLAVVDEFDSCPVSLIDYMMDYKLLIKNNLKQNKAISVLGAFSVTAGTFEVTVDVNAYFNTLAAIQATRDNSNVTFELHHVKANAGFSFDLPLIALSKSAANVKQDEPITIPLSADAATGALIDPSLDYTLLFMFWDYLPDAAG